MFRTVFGLNLKFVCLMAYECKFSKNVQKIIHNFLKFLFLEPLRLCGDFFDIKSSDGTIQTILNRILYL